MKIRFIYRCVLYFLISMLISPYYDGWSSTAKYLISEGVFSKYCSNNIERSKLPSLHPVCDEQAFNVGKLLSFYRISEFLSSIFTGLFMDNCGPKLTIIVSIILRIISWLLIPLFPNSTGVIILSCILCGISSNGIAFPVFTIAQYTKRFYNPAMIVISISLCFGTFYMFILNHIKEFLPPSRPIYVILVMLALTHVPLLVLSIFIFPNSLQKDVTSNEPGVADADTDKLKSLEALSFSNVSPSEEHLYKHKYASDHKIASINVEMNSRSTLMYNKLENNSEDLKSDNTEDVQSVCNRDDYVSYAGNTNVVSSSDSIYIRKHLSAIGAAGLAIQGMDMSDSNAEFSSVNSSAETNPKLCNVQELEPAGSKFQVSGGAEDKWQFTEFLAILRRVDILTISFASMVGVISLTFAQESFPISYGKDSVALKVNEVLIPVSFVFSLASVFLLDKIGPVPIIVGLNVMSSVLHLTMMFVNRILSIFTSILMSLGYSLFMTQYYLYLDNQVPLKYQGSIKGFLVTSIGFVLFINIGLNYLSKTYFYTREIHLVLMILRLLVTIPLIKFLRHTRKMSASQELNV